MGFLGIPLSQYKKSRIEIQEARLEYYLIAFSHQGNLPGWHCKKERRVAHLQTKASLLTIAAVPETDLRESHKIK